MNNWLSKLKSGLQKSSAKLTSELDNIFNKQKPDLQTIDELEEALISSDMGVRAAGRIINNFRDKRLAKNLTSPEIKQALADDIETILKPCEQAFTITKPAHHPFVILMVGVNGAGKTTTIGKLAAQLKDKYKISFIAADTFRAAAVEQLEAWGKKCGITVRKGAPGCDAAGLCYDALSEAVRQEEDVVFIDTAGRLQNKIGLMDELKKIIKVIAKVVPDAPHCVLLTIDAATGQNALEQIKTFNDAAHLSGLIITKLDGSAKGGSIVAMAEDSKLPIYFIGVGEHIEDLQKFDAHSYARSLLEIDDE